MKTREITPLQYASLNIKGKTLQNITKHLRAGNPLPGVLRVKKFSRFYILEVPITFTGLGFEEIATLYQK